MRHFKFILLIFIIFIIACSDNKSNDSHHHPELITGKQLFDYHCAICHGIKGKGQFIKGIPANVLTEKTPDMVIKKIRYGGDKLTVMPIFKNMPEDEAKLIVKHLFQLKSNLLNE